jgi:hypothetical protein
MKTFFSSLNFPRAVILVMLLASAVLGYFVWQRTTRLHQIERELVMVKSRVRETQQLALQLNDLQRLSEREGLVGEADPEFYIRGVASQDRVQIGQVDTSVSTSTPMRGVEDKKYKITPSNKNARYSRTQIGNFLYKLEADSRRVRVTHIRITPVSRVKPGEIGPDVWTFEAEITSRQAIEG